MALIFEIDGERHNCVAFTRELTGKPVNLGAFEEKLACPRGIRITDILNMRIGTDMAIKKKGLTPKDPDKTVL